MRKSDTDQSPGKTRFLTSACFRGRLRAQKDRVAAGGVDLGAAGLRVNTEEYNFMGCNLFDRLWLALLPV